MAVKAIKRERLLGIPIDIVPQSIIGDVVQTMLSGETTCQIVFVSWWDVVRALWHRTYRVVLKRASLVIPTSRAITAGLRFVRKAVPTRYLPFDFVILLFAAMDRLNASAYLMGLDMYSIQRIANNISETFPNMRVVGHYSGSIGSKMEHTILTAIGKASPHLFLCGGGITGGDIWIYRNRSRLKSGIMLCSNETIEILAEKRRPPSRKLSRLGLDFLPGLLLHPWRIVRLPIFILYCLSLSIEKIIRR